MSIFDLFKSGKGDNRQLSSYGDYARRSLLRNECKGAKHAGKINIGAFMRHVDCEFVACAAQWDGSPLSFEGCVFDEDSTVTVPISSLATAIRFVEAAAKI